MKLFRFDFVNILETSLSHVQNSSISKLCALHTVVTKSPPNDIHKESTDLVKRYSEVIIKP